MKKLALLLMAGLFLGAQVYASTPADQTDFVGKWKFDNTHAPYIYQQGTFDLHENEGALVGELEFSDGYAVDLQDLNVKEGILTFGMNIESYYITVSTTVEDEKLKGTVVTPDGDMPFEAVKVTKEEQDQE